MKNAPYSQTNKAISKLTDEFAQMHNEVLNSINALTQVHTNIFETHEGNNSDPSLTSTSISS